MAHPTPSNPSTAQQRLKDAGLRATPARLEVLRVMAKLERPVSHAVLAVQPSLRKMDPVTLYRTLATLEDERLLHRVLGVDGTWRYCTQPNQAAGCPGNHVHFLCTVCGSMTCLVKQAMPRVAVPAGTVVTGRNFLAFGQCGACSNKRRPRR